MMATYTFNNVRTHWDRTPGPEPPRDDYPVAVRPVVSGSTGGSPFSKQTTRRVPKADAILLRVATVDGCWPKRLVFAFQPASVPGVGGPGHVARSYLRFRRPSSTPSGPARRDRGRGELRLG
jgi:hypothetical protein